MNAPAILNLNNKKDRQLFLKLKKTAFVVDEIREQIKELIIVKNPKILMDPKKVAARHRKSISDVWVYYPWKNTLIRCLDKKDFKKLRLSRNKNLILSDEQKKLEKIRVGITGLNVGNPGALCLALEGDIEMKLTDNDVLGLSNLNRFRAGLCDLGVNKAILTARQIYEINPFAKLKVYPEGINAKNIEKFLLKPKIDILVEEMDNLPLKVRIRELAREHRIPTIMVTGNGENVIIDIERFDLQANLPLMNGYLKQRVVNEIAVGSKSFSEKIILARDFMGAKYLNKRLVKSFDLVGTKLAGIPQIAESSFLRGAVIAYAVRQIVTANKLPSGRYNLRLDNVVR